MGSDDWSHISAHLMTSQVDGLHFILSQNSVFVQQTALEEKDSIFWNKDVIFRGFPGGSVVKNLPANAEDAGSTPGLGLSLRGENGNILQYSCLGNPMNRGAWRAIQFMGLQKLDTTE